MCRNIKTLFNFDPPATKEEIEYASIQFVRKLSGFHTPSIINEAAFTLAVAKITEDAQTLLQSLITNTQPRNRIIEEEHARATRLKKFGTK